VWENPINRECFQTKRPDRFTFCSTLFEGDYFILPIIVALVKILEILKNEIVKIPTNKILVQMLEPGLELFLQANQLEECGIDNEVEKREGGSSTLACVPRQFVVVVVVRREVGSLGVVVGEVLARIPDRRAGLTAAAFASMIPASLLGGIHEAECGVGVHHIIGNANRILAAFRRPETTSAFAPLPGRSPIAWRVVGTGQGSGTIRARLWVYGA